MTVEPLNEVAHIVMGQSPPSHTYNSIGDGLPFFQGKADFGDRQPYVRIFCSHPVKIAERGDILISVRAPVGPTNVAPSRCCIGRGLAAIRGKSLEPIFLLHFLRYHEPDLARKGKGSTFEAVNRDDLENIRVPVPALPEQKRIAAILEKADRLRRTRRYARQLSDTFLQAVFLEMVGDPVLNSQGWNIEHLQDLIDSKRPITYGILKPGDNVPDGVQYVRVVDMQDGGINATGIRRTTREIAHEYRRSTLKPADILLSIRGHVGRLAIVPSFLSGANITQDTARLAPNDRMHGHYLLECLRFRSLQARMGNLTRGAAVQGINLGDVRLLPIPVPPLPLQQKFAAIVRRFERLRAQQREAERQAEHLFQTLLHRAFSSGL